MIQTENTAAYVRIVWVPVVVTEIDDIEAVEAQIFFYALIQPVHIWGDQYDGFVHD